jgi:hypothetical protein
VCVARGPRLSGQRHKAIRFVCVARGPRLCWEGRGLPFHEGCRSGSSLVSGFFPFEEKTSHSGQEGEKSNIFPQDMSIKSCVRLSFEQNSLVRHGLVEGSRSPIDDGSGGGVKAPGEASPVNKDGTLTHLQCWLQRRQASQCGPCDRNQKRGDRETRFDECSSGSRSWMGNFAALIRVSSLRQHLSQGSFA